MCCRSIQSCIGAPASCTTCILVWCFRIPELGDRNSYVAAIEALPLVQTPEVFGLHANADISYYTSATKALWRNLVCCMHMCFNATPGLCLVSCVMQLKSYCHVLARVGLRTGEQQRAQVICRC